MVSGLALSRLIRIKNGILGEEEICPFLLMDQSGKRRLRRLSATLGCLT